MRIRKEKKKSKKTSQRIFKAIIEDAKEELIAEKEAHEDDELDLGSDEDHYNSFEV
jgi:hypothetical protein